MRIAREALPFVLPPLIAAVACAAFGLPIVAAVLLLLCLFLLYFFRDPKRSFEGPPELVLAPADGTITKIDRVQDPALAELTGGTGEALRIVTFLSVFNVHLQRCPCEGSVVGVSRRDGKAVAAFRDDADDVNQSYLTVLERAEGECVGIRQIVGLVARRIVPYLSAGMQVERGDYLGIIKFGSRVDLLLPTSYDVLVKVGDKLEGGATPVAMPTDPSTNPPPTAG